MVSTNSFLKSLGSFSAVLRFAENDLRARKCVSMWGDAERTLSDFSRRRTPFRYKSKRDVMNPRRRRGISLMRVLGYLKKGKDAHPANPTRGFSFFSRSFNVPPAYIWS